MSQEIEKYKLQDQNFDNDELDVYEPGSVEELISYLKRNFNGLNESNLVQRKKCILNIEERLLQEEGRLSGMVSQQLLVKFHKQLLQAFADKTEKVREKSIEIFKMLITRCDDMSPFLPYLFSVVTDRVNAVDLEGIQHLPEIMRPPPGQKPKRLIKLVEESEEVRMGIVQLMNEIVNYAQNNELVQYLDDVSNILRTLAMDPSGDIQREACLTISAFCRNNKEMLLHFTELLGRAILLPLISKKSKVRIAALDALGSIFYCGIWKYNAFVFENLVGFRDPNSVPIKDFYEPSHNINYFATLITDPKIQVREFFIRQVGDWMIELDDRYDHHARLIPYVLSGLFDEFPQIRDTSFEILQEAGKMEEKEKEKEILEKKQFGIDNEWTQNGKLSQLPISEFIPERPNLGARMLIRSHVRKFWGALYKEIKDVSVEHRERAAKLLLIAVSFSEDHMTQYLDVFIRNLIWHTVDKNPEDKKVAAYISRAFELVGRYCSPDSYVHLILSGLKGEFSKDDEYLRAAIKALACLLNGSLEAVVKDQGFPQKKLDFIVSIIKLLKEDDFLEEISLHNFNEAALLYQTLINRIQENATEKQLKFLQGVGLNVINQMGFVINKIALFDQTFIMTIPYQQENCDQILKSLGNNSIHQLISKGFQKEEQSISQVINNFYNSIQEIGYSFNSYGWKLLIGQAVYLIFEFAEFEKDQHSDILGSISLHFKSFQNQISKGDNPEIGDFIVKFSLLLLNGIKQELIKDQNLVSVVYSGCIKMLGEVFYWLGATQQELNVKIVKEYKELLKLSAKQCFSGKYIDIFQKIFNEQSDFTGVSNFIVSFDNIFRRHYKINQGDQIMEILNPFVTKFVVPVFSKKRELLQFLVADQTTKVRNKKQPFELDSNGGNYIKLGENSENKEKKETDVKQIQQEGENKDNQDNQEKQDNQENQEKWQNQQKYHIVKEKVFVLPLLFKFVLTRVEQIGETPNQEKISLYYGTLKQLVELIPNQGNKGFYKGDDYLLENYEGFYGKLLKYTVDEKDIDQREALIQIIKKLIEKTPVNFQMELEIAEKHKQFTRIQLLKHLCNKE